MPAENHPPEADAPPTVWGYARVSTTGQNLALQRAALERAGCRPEHIVEETESGARTRPLFDGLLARLRAGDSLVVWHIDRLGRNAMELQRVAQDLRDRGIRLVITTLGIDTTTPTGKLVYGIVAQIAELERDRLIERTRAGLASARARNQALGRRPSLTAHQRAEAKRMILEDGRSYGAVAAHFNVSRSVAWRAVNGSDKRAKVAGEAGTPRTTVARKRKGSRKHGAPA